MLSNAPISGLPQDRGGGGGGGGEPGGVRIREAPGGGGGVGNPRELESVKRTWVENLTS